MNLGTALATYLSVIAARRTSAHLCRLWVLALALLAPAVTSAQYAEQLGSPAAPLPVTAGAVAGSDEPSTDSVPSSADAWTFDLSALTSVPLSVGVAAQVQAPIGLFANVSFGHTPAAYLGMVASLLRDQGVYRDRVAPVISEATANGGWNVRLGVGLNPVEGLELGIGYTYLGAASTLSTASLELATGQRLQHLGMTEIPIHINIHALHGRVGYRVVVGQLVMRLSVGWTHTVAAEVHLEVPDVIRERPGNPATEFEQAAGDAFSQYGFTPEVQLSAGYRF